MLVIDWWGKRYNGTVKPIPCYHAHQHQMNSPASNTTPNQNSPFVDKKELSNLLSFEAGARVLFATDEWFACAENLLKDGPPIFIPNLYCREVCN